MPEQFYVVLAVSADADLRKIRGAYRKLVKLYHPDLTDGDIEKYEEIEQAYKTLPPEEPLKYKPHPPTQPLKLARRQGEAPAALPLETEGLHSAVDEFFHGWVPGFFRTGRQVSRKKNLYVELIIEPGEAIEGGLFPLKVPVEHPCRECNGTGNINNLTCPACHARGRVVDYHDIEVSVPPNVTDGTEARLSLDDIGLNGVDLIVLVSVA
jgi:molecular chaperone DnaJ